MTRNSWLVMNGYEEYQPWMSYMGDDESNWENWVPGGTIDLGLSVRWGYANVGVPKFDSYTVTETPIYEWYDGVHYTTGHTYTVQDNYDNWPCHNEDFYRWGDPTYSSSYSLSSYKSDDLHLIDESPLPLSNDIAYQTDGCRIPTESEWDELFSDTDQDDVTIHGQPCCKFMRKSNHNDYIIIPYVGYYTDNGWVDDHHYYWTSESDRVGIDWRDREPYAYCYCVYHGEVPSKERYYGLPVRGVKDD